MKHFANITPLEQGGSELRPPMKEDRADPDWELEGHKELVMQNGQGGALVLIVCYWRQPPSSKLH